jgi:hypothetical protein
MILLGIALLIIGLLTGIWIIWILGVIAVVFGLLAFASGGRGRPSALVLAAA